MQVGTARRILGVAALRLVTKRATLGLAMSGKKREMSESGMIVYPKLPVPKPRGGDAKLPYKPTGGAGKLAAFLIVLALLGGAAVGFFVRPIVMEDARLVDAQHALAKQNLAFAEAQTEIAKLQDAANKLDQQRDLLDKQLEAVKQAEEMVAGKTAASTKLEQDLATTTAKLATTGAGAAATDGNQVRLSIPTGKLFKTADELSSEGQQLLDRVAAALKELADKQIAVHGHTDDHPPPKPVAPKSADKKSKKPPPVAKPAPALELATNWELSSARALAVVHYLQDVHKIEASRLSAVAFSQYRPISKSNRAANRRVDIVLTPRPKQ